MVAFPDYPHLIKDDRADWDLGCGGSPAKVNGRSPLLPTTVSVISTAAGAIPQRGRGGIQGGDVIATTRVSLIRRRFHSQQEDQL